MAAQPPPRSSGSAGVGHSGTAWHRGRGGGFEWVAPSPSPVVVAELERLFPDIVQVPVQPLEGEEGRWENQAILARCLSRWIPPKIIIREFHRAALPGTIEALALANKHYIFQFSDVRAKALALGRPWVVYGQPIITAEWMPEFVPVDSSIHFALLWIRLPQLPIEFWNDEILSSILAVAGQFLYSDEATKERKRGSFARACVRIDLSKPLRPGARIRGSRAPFWQQFCYENLEGICADCGSVHLAGPCQAVPNPSSPSSGSGFGPWMTAIRRRKPPQEPLSSEQNGGSRPSPALADGWQVPKKIARRQSSRETVSIPPSVGLNPHQSASSPEKGAGGCSDAVTFEMPVPVGTVAMFQPVGSSVLEGAIEVSVTEGVTDPNPFACLGSASRTARSKSQVDGCNGPLKRTRPAELMTQRVASRTTKAKGKVPLGGKAGTQGPFSFQATGESTRGSIDLTGPGKKRFRRKDGPGLRTVSGTSLTTQPLEPTHDSAVLLLKKAILRGDEVEALGSSHLVESTSRAGEVEAMDSFLLEDCRAKGPVEGSNSAVDEMMGDRVGVPPAHVSE